ncbi:MAG: alpha/beta fold hydrolase [Candidatus Melainabacteria bacterium]|nr:alpha/beta fold hydrolase [Candidatus Melainabacteria bacterium]
MEPAAITLNQTSRVFELPGRTGKPLYCRQWGDEQEARALVLIIHGLGAHSGWFEAFGSRLAMRRFGVFSFDQVGFGLRKDQTFNSRSQWQDEAVAVYNHVAGLASGKPVFLMGNSMGALVAVKICRLLNPRPGGVAIFSPGFDGFPGRFTIPYKLKAVATALIAPDTELALPYTVDDITSNQAVRDELAQDELKRLTIPARMGLELLNFTNELKKEVQTLPVPLFMATAGIETIVDNRHSERFFDKVDSPEKTRVTMDDCWHDLMFEAQLPRLLDELEPWLVRNLSST